MLLKEEGHAHVIATDTASKHQIPGPVTEADPTPIIAHFYTEKQGVKKY